MGDFDLLPEEATSASIGDGRRRLVPRHRAQNSSWTKTTVRYVSHTHDWEIRGFSQTDCRYLETAFSVKDNSNQSVYLEPGNNHTYKIRLHPQGNKSSNLEFTFFQIFSLAQNAKFKARFYVYNTSGEEIETTVYSGAQQLNGVFQYCRRSDLLKHIEVDDELRLSVSLTSYSDPLMRQGNYLAKEPADVCTYPDEALASDMETAFNNDRFSDFQILCGERKQVLYVHRIVLASRSNYFSALLSSHTKEFSEGKLELPDVDFEIFSELIFFIYTGKAPRLRVFGLELLGLADRFQLNALKNLAIQVLKENLRTDSVCDVLTKAELYNVADLKEAAMDFVVQNSATILKTSQWSRFVEAQPKLVTEICVAMSSDSVKQSSVEPLSKRQKFG